MSLGAVWYVSVSVPEKDKTHRTKRERGMAYKVIERLNTRYLCSSLKCFHGLNYICLSHLYNHLLCTKEIHGPCLGSLFRLILSALR